MLRSGALLLKFHGAVGRRNLQLSVTGPGHHLGGATAAVALVADVSLRIKRALLHLTVGAPEVI